jgi:ribose transport system substrate-binding protein
MTRRSVKIFLLVLSAIALVAVSASAWSQKSSAKDPSKLVYFIFTGYAYPYFAPMAQAVTQASAHFPGMTMRIVNANNSASTEITDIKEAVAAGAQGIILNTIQESVTGAAKEAMAQGVPVITIDRDVSNPKARIVFIGDNDMTLGREETQYAVDYLASHNVPKPWHVAVLQGTLGASVTIGRLKGAMDVLKPLEDNGSVKIILNQSANFATDTAQTMISTLLAKTSDIQLVVCGNDAEALGAINAFKSAGVALGSTTFVVGADAQPQSLQAVRNGTQLDTVTHSPFVEAYWAVEAMQNYLQSGTRPGSVEFPDGNVIIPMTLVTKDNVGTIAAWGTPQTIAALPYGSAMKYRISMMGSNASSTSNSTMKKY